MLPALNGFLSFFPNFVLTNTWWKIKNQEILMFVSFVERTRYCEQFKDAFTALNQIRSGVS
jgi:hypothetical protein